jgi:FkbM family methyltransferase
MKMRHLKQPTQQPGLMRVCGHTFLGGALSSDSVVFDIGANRGTFAREVLRLYGCRVHAVEPAPKLSAELRRCPMPGLTVQAAAVASRAGTARLVISANVEASCLEHANGVAESIASGQAVEVETITLEGLLASTHAAGERAQIDLVKLDIEGAELDVLESTSEQTLGRIQQLTVEFHQFLHPEAKPRIENIKRRLQRLGFWCLDLSRCNYDVLFARYELGLGGWARVKLRGEKYRTGVGRWLSRRRMTRGSDAA